jgi:hypothetical protein
VIVCKALQGSEHARDQDHNPDDQGRQAGKHQKVIQDPYHPDPPTLRNWECLGSRGSRGIHGQSKGGSGSLRPRGASCRLKMLGVNRHDGLSLNGPLTRWRPRVAHGPGLFPRSGAGSSKIRNGQANEQTAKLLAQSWSVVSAGSLVLDGRRRRVTPCRSPRPDSPAGFLGAGEGASHRSLHTLKLG